MFEEYLMAFLTSRGFKYAAPLRGCLVPVLGECLRKQLLLSCSSAQYLYVYTTFWASLTT